MTDPQIELRSQLESLRGFVADKFPKEFHYRGMQDFVLRHGRFFEPRPVPKGIKPGPVGECYSNAFVRASLGKIPYVEGYAFSSCRSLHLHAWNLDAEDFVIDTTWNPIGVAYFGVIFPDFVFRIFGSDRKKHPIIDDWRHGWPLLQVPFEP
jgi:hypothetical protein